MCLPTNRSADYQTHVFLPLWSRDMHVRVLSHTDKISDSVLSLWWLFFLGRRGLRLVYLGLFLSLVVKSRRCHGGHCLTARFRDPAVWGG